MCNSIAGGVWQTPPPGEVQAQRVGKWGRGWREEEERGRKERRERTLKRSKQRCASTCGGGTRTHARARTRTP